MSLLSLVAGVCALGVAESPTVKVTADDTVIRQSCRVEIPAGAVIEDVNGNGVIQIEAPGIVVEFAEGAVLRGSPTERRPDEYKGYGIRLNGHANVTVRNATVSGYWCGVYASQANGLALEGIDASDNRRQHLKSTPAAEDGSDWLWPHNNDKNEWLNNYGAAICIEDSEGVTVRECRVRHGQNALVLDRVRNANIYDNDFSFNSGWGIAMWRSEKNIISRNAIDFCVRGYSHGVYNRGQDSAGILCFEQNNGNIIAENSITHGGDGFFGFAGREAIADVGQHPDDWYRRRGNSNNILIGNDLSYAPAHGIEMTFSFGNRFLNNRIVGNAICGVWGGYSQDTLISGNVFEDNGGMGYGLERGGVNIEHGRKNRVVRNIFKDNKCGVHFWGGPNPDFQAKPWGKVNGIESIDNVIAGNRFTGDALAVHFRGPGEVTLGQNDMEGVGKEVTAEAQHQVKRAKVEMESAEAALPELPGRTKPVGARAALRGRDKIIMTEWGPWDHQSPMVRQVGSTASQVEFELHRMPGPVQATLRGNGVSGSLMMASGQPGRYVLKADRPGVYTYAATIASGAFTKEIEGSFVVATWDATFFRWTAETDPREKLDAYRKLAEGPTAVTVALDDLTLKYGMGGPGDLKLSEKVTQAKLGGDRFGMMARTKLPLPKGKWQFRTISDDGVRITVDGRVVIDNWTWHVPTTDKGVLELKEGKAVEITAEHFEIDGVAAFELQISRAP